MQVFNQRSNGVPTMATHLTPAEREVLSQMWFAKRPKTEMAQRLGRDRSTIYRELRRNGSPTGYSAVDAQQLAQARRRERPRTGKMERPEVNQYVRQRLTRHWSPDQIAGRVKREHPQEPDRWVSHQTIYTWIGRDQDREHWRTFLRRGQRRRDDRRGKLPRAASIQGRPPEVDRRQRVGDWEGDTIVSAGRRGGVVSLVERKSGYLLLAKVENLKAKTVHRACRRKLRPLPPELRRTLTLDNGKEFAEHRRLTRQLALPIYFADPYCAWQRGTNEHTNGLVRQYFPKGTAFADVSHHAVARVAELLNGRPRKRHGYRTPHEVLQAESVAFET